MTCGMVRIAVDFDSDGITFEKHVTQVKDFEASVRLARRL